MKLTKKKSLSIVSLLLLVLGISTSFKVEDIFSTLHKPTQENYKQKQDLPKNERIPVTLARYVDGDTSHFFLHDEKIIVRYLLIDTPETVKPNSPPQPFGHEASERTKDLLANAKKIEIELDAGEQTDHYGRVLAYVFVDDELVQDILVREGLARVSYVKKPSTRYLFQLELSQKKAQLGKKGIWSKQGYVTDNGFVAY